MSFIEKLIIFLNTSGEIPTVFGIYHIVSLVIIAAMIAALCIFAKNSGKKAVVNTVLFTAIIVIILEIYKQINYTFRMEDGVLITDYQWYAFPFQFCSTPMYVGLLAGMLKKGKLQNACYAYLATYAVFAGVCVMLYPVSVFIGTVGINIQTMICHGSMIVIGVWLLHSGHVKLQHKTILQAIPVFAACVGLAVVMNEIAHATGLLERETFDMFFISPYGTPSLPVYSLVQGAVPFPWCLVIYVLAFSLAAYLMLLAAIAIKKLAGRKEKQAV